MKIYEIDIENAFVEKANDLFGYEIIGRQIELPVGIADVLAFGPRLSQYANLRPLIVFEIKMDKAPDSVVAQAIGYSSSIEDYLTHKFLNPSCEINYFDWDNFIGVKTIIIAKKLGRMGIKALRSGAIDFISYELSNNGIDFHKVHIEDDYSYQDYDVRFRNFVHSWFMESYKSVVNDPSNMRLWCAERRAYNYSSPETTHQLEDINSCPEIWGNKGE